ncbi:MAG: hypothetical protein ACREBU_01540 [Nitrososphaera sp.]
MRTPRPYRSGFEWRLATGPLAGLEYEPKDQRLVYALVKVYTPDFVNKDRGVLIEAKGRFRGSDEARKYLAVREYNPDVDLRFVLLNPDVRAYPGARMTLADWMVKHDFNWCTEDSIPQTWRVL